MSVQGECRGRLTDEGLGNGPRVASVIEVPKTYGATAVNGHGMPVRGEYCGEHGRLRGQGLSDRLDSVGQVPQHYLATPVHEGAPFHSKHTAPATREL